MGDRADAMRANGTYNERHADVRAEQFSHGVFFDARDAVQVKYEMVRSVARRELSVTGASALYGMSRQTCHRCLRDVEREGIAGLMPRKRGPKDGYKLDAGAKAFVDAYLLDHPDAGNGEVAAALKEGAGVDVHPRTIGRYRSKKR